MSQPDDTYKTGTNADTSLEDFFCRPIKIYSIDWVVGNALSVRFDPWSLFFSNPRVINRITNFNLLQCKLKLKFIINGTIFHYSRVLVSYIPLYPSDKCSKVRTGIPADIVEYSQRPHIFLDPTYSQGGTMSLPFFWYKNWLNIPNSEWSQMGTISMDSLAILKHANGATAGVNISVFAWAEDVKLSVPTTIDSSSLVIQSGDEYGQKKVSNMATSVARAMSQLEMTPIIGPYAKATSMLASTTAAVASAFGYSRPNVIDAPSHMRPLMFGNFSNTDVDDTSFKLSLDAKQELSVDSRTVGLTGQDEMTVASIATRSSFLTSFSWLYSTAPETHLFSTYVMPTLYHIYNTELHNTACSFASLPFQYWHSSMKFRFQVVSSAFHKGRLKIVYDPGTMDASTSEYNTAYTRIIDISEEKDFQMTVGWGHEKTFLKVPLISSISPVYSSSILPVDRVHTNGTLSVFVVNELTIPNTTIANDIQINVFVSCDDDVEFSVLTDYNIANLSYMPQPPLTIQTGNMEMCDNCPEEGKEVDQLVSSSVDSHVNSVFFGETIVSFRKLLKRYQLHSMIACSSTTDNNDYIVNFTSQNFPLSYGYATNGVHTIGTDAVNIVHNTLICYLSPGFVAMRGALRYKYKWLNQAANNSDFHGVTRSNDQYIQWNVGLTTYNVPSSYTQSQFAQHHLKYKSSLLNGAYLTTGGNNPVIEVELPHYDSNRFLGAKNPMMLTDEISPGQFCHVYESQIRGTSSYDILSRYVSVGEDFSLFFFTGAPVMYQVLLFI